MRKKWNLKREHNLTTSRPGHLCILNLQFVFLMLLFTHIDTATVEKGLKIKALKMVKVPPNPQRYLLITGFIQLTTMPKDQY